MRVYYLYQSNDTITDSGKYEVKSKSVSCIMLFFKYKCKPMISKPMNHTYRDKCKEGMNEQYYN